MGVTISQFASAHATVADWYVGAVRDGAESILIGLQEIAEQQHLSSRRQQAASLEETAASMGS